MNETHEQMTLAWLTYLEEIDKFFNRGTKAAASRASKALREIRILAEQRRREILEAKNAKQR